MNLKRPGAATPFVELDDSVMVAVETGKSHLRLIHAARGGGVVAAAAKHHTAGARNTPVAEVPRVLRGVDDLIDNGTEPALSGQVRHRVQAARIGLAAENVAI